MSICILAAGKLAALAISAFTLSWTHSVQKTAWEEDWQMTPAGFAIAEARVQGSGAGMEPPEGSVFDGIWWRYRPPLKPQPQIVLGDSGVAGAWTLCAAGQCTELGGAGEGPVILKQCPGNS